MAVRLAASMRTLRAEFSHRLLRPELQRRIRNRAFKVAKLFQHATQVLKTFEGNPVQLGKACDVVVRRLCASVWRFIGTKAK